MSNVRLPQYQHSSTFHRLETWTVSAESGVPYVYFCILKSFLQILVDSFIRDLADQSKIRYSYFLLLCRIESSLLDIRLPGRR